MPKRCVFCGVIASGDDEYICAGCVQDLPRIRFACRRCGVPLEVEPDATCASCQDKPPPFTCVVAPLRYEFPIDAAIKAFKFQRKLFYTPAFTEILLAAASRLPSTIDAILPVPLHRWRKLRRGYNQAYELARPIAAQLHLPILSSVVRSVATPPQSGLDAAERQKNLRGAFRVRARPGARHVLLVDDVMTTGATCVQLAELLINQGVPAVSVLVLARA